MTKKVSLKKFFTKMQRINYWKRQQILKDKKVGGYVKRYREL